ncbi:hypothetical protein CL652_00605 [bacterium]|nr:hypothetical protein [bacterium]|tara:strand:+ start:3472 stop:3696 length:225 start_codon:yes stop_codon:yes gene_type:complete
MFGFGGDNYVDYKKTVPTNPKKFLQVEVFNILIVEFPTYSPQKNFIKFFCKTKEFDPFPHIHNYNNEFQIKNKK